MMAESEFCCVRGREVENRVVTVEFREAPVVYLLLTTDVVELHGLHPLRVVEVRDRRIVERDVSVLADAHHHDVSRGLLQDLRVAFALRLGFGGRAVDQVHRLERYEPEDVRLEEVAETLRRVPVESDVLVHAAGIDPVPRDVDAFHKRLEDVVLRRRSREDHVDLVFPGQKHETKFVPHARAAAFASASVTTPHGNANA